jgi:predicted amidohydrolase
VNVVSTLVKESGNVLVILESVPRGSIVLLPENEKFGDKNWDEDENFKTVSEVSKLRNLFVLINEPVAQDGLRYDSMIGLDNGTPMFWVRKYHLFDDEAEFIARPPKPEPIVKIRGVKTGIAICYELSKIGGYGRLWEYGTIFQEANIELLLLPAVWEYNWRLPQLVVSACFRSIPNLKLCAFSSSNIENPESYGMVWKKDKQGEIGAISRILDS